MQDKGRPEEEEDGQGSVDPEGEEEGEEGGGEQVNQEFESGLQELVLTDAGTQFTCFTGTTVQILTQKVPLAGAAPAALLQRLCASVGVPWCVEGSQVWPYICLCVRCGPVHMCTQIRCYLYMHMSAFLHTSAR